LKIMEVRDQYLAADAEGRAKLLAKTYGLSRHQVWQHKQSGKYIVSHAGVEQIAALEGLTVAYDVVNMDQQFVVLGAAVRDRDGAVVGQPTFGEASPKNTQQTYMVAMAEKRAFDRAVLKAVLGVVGGHGGDFYSEEEADDFSRKPAAAKKADAANNGDDTLFKVQQALDRCFTREAVEQTFRGFTSGMDKTGDDYKAIGAACAKRAKEVGDA
jgi:hypothetical protein